MSKKKAIMRAINYVDNEAGEGFCDAEEIMFELMDAFDVEDLDSLNPAIESALNI